MELFLVSSNNDTKILLKQMIKFLDNSTYKNALKKTLGGLEIWKFTYIALYKFSLLWLRLSLFWGNFFKDIFIWLIIGWQLCILGWVSDRYSYLLKSCCNYISSFSLIYFNEGNGRK